MHQSHDIDALAKALTAAQGAMQNAPLNKTNPHFKSKYADLVAIRDATLPHLNKHGLTITQQTMIGEHGFVLVTRLMHEGGQWMESVYPLPTQGKPQEVGSALTYARRYSWAAMCGIAADEDDDGNAAQNAKRANGNGATADGGRVTEKQAEWLRTLIEETGADIAKFCAYFKIEAVPDLPAGEYDRAVQSLEARRQKG